MTFPSNRIISKQNVDTIHHTERIDGQSTDMHNNTTKSVQITLSNVSVSNPDAMKPMRKFVFRVNQSFQPQLQIVTIL